MGRRTGRLGILHRARLAMMNTNCQCTKCRAIDRTQETEIRERVKMILKGMIYKIVEHVPIQLDDRVEEIIDACRGLR
jgi:hypothetical protein